MAHLVFRRLAGQLPTSEFDLMERDQKVGFLQIRHQLSHGEGIPEHMASHLYYEINPEFRQKGYGKEIVQLGLEEARKIGLKELMATCFEDNPASQRIIETSGGSLIERAELPMGNLRKYRFDLSS